MEEKTISSLKKLQRSIAEVGHASALNISGLYKRGNVMLLRQFSSPATGRLIRVDWKMGGDKCGEILRKEN